jgi:hypothetical protein
MKQKLWCCVDINFGKSYYELQSLSDKKKDSMAFVLGYYSDWETAKKSGWKCIRVEVEIKPI